MKLLAILILNAFLLVLFFNACKEQNNPEQKTGLYSINVDGSGEMQLVNGSVGSYYFIEGDKIIYDYISSMNIDGTDQHKIIPSNVFSDNNVPGDFSISPSRNKIVFSSSQISPKASYLYLMNVDGSVFNKISILDTLSNKSSPQFSYDGNNIVFTTTYGIYESNVDGANLRKLLSNHLQKNLSYIQPSFSPDDKNIIYVEYNDSTGKFVSLHLMNISSLKDTIIYSSINSYQFYYEVSPDYFVLFVIGSSIIEVNLKDLSKQILDTGTDAHYSPDFSYITYIDPNNTSIDVYNLTTENIQNIKIPGRFSSIAEPKLSPNHQEVIFLGGKYSF